MTSDRYCPFCDDVIPHISKNGTPIKDYHYRNKKTCPKHDCIGEYQMQQNHRKKVFTVTLTPIDLFNAGMI